jgi:hypothetical protein
MESEAASRLGCISIQNERASGEGNVLRRRFIKHQQTTPLAPQQGARNTKQLALPMTEMQFLNQHIKRVIVLVCIAVRNNNLVPETHVFKRLDDGFVGALREGIGVETHGARQQVCVLWEADEARADCLAGETVDGERVDGYGAVGQLDHAEEGEDKGGFAAAVG